jgi:hypothetical protein
VQHDGYPKQHALAKTVVLFSILTRAKLPVAGECIAVVSVKGNGKLVVLCHLNQTARNPSHSKTECLPRSGERTLVQQKEGRRGTKMVLRNCRKCRWVEVCIDPCDDCPNMNAVKLDASGEPIPETFCPYEQGDKNCHRVVAPTCESFEPRLAGVDLKVIRIKEKLS